MTSDGQHGRGPLEGMVAVVTGASKGIGRESALALAGAGADLRLIDIADLGDTIAAAQALGAKAEGLAADVADRAAVAAAMRQAVGSPERIDVLVTSAGIYGTTTGIDDLDEAELDRVLDVNLKGTLWSIQAALPMMRQYGGTIVCLGSAAGKVGGVLSGPPYVVSKGAVHALVKWVARHEAAHGIRANGIAAGAVATDMIAGKGYPPSYCPLNRIADPAEIAAAVMFLASPASSYVTGTVMDVSGGFFMGG